ncbi:MAG: lytic transglycosylase domain-containing protein [Pseudobdellovibrionaceae bacterium]
MHNEFKKRGLQLKLVALVAGLLIGVVCGTAHIGAAFVEQAPVPLKKNQTILAKADRIDAVQTRPTSEKEPLLLDDVSGEVKSSAGYKIVLSAVRNELKRGRPTYALKLLGADALAAKLKHSEFDRIKAQIAQSYLIEGKIARAAQVAEEAVKRSGKAVPLAGWVAGQAAWRTGDFGRAADMFALTAHAPQASSWLVAAGAYWAARANIRAGRDSDITEDLYAIAGKYPRTFYGFMARQASGDAYEFNWDAPEMDSGDEEAIAADNNIRNALGLGKSGKLAAAISAIASSKWFRDQSKREALLAFVSAQKVPALTLFLARKTVNEDGAFYDSALYPESPWAPKSGYSVDKALIHALIRQESRFNPYAQSGQGARGLMQILPSTAQFIAARVTGDLSDPHVNMEVGQKYVAYLLKDPVVNNDIFKMAVAYNAGPGNLARWSTQLGQMDDPLLFIESIPSGETRAFVERVVVNYWIYRAQQGADNPSLDAVVALDKPDAIRVASSSPRPLETAQLDTRATNLDK